MEIGPVERLPDADTVDHPYGGLEYTPREVLLGDDFARERSDHRGDRRRLRRGDDGEWARKSGHEIAKRGRIPVEVIDAYRAAH